MARVPATGRVAASNRVAASTRTSPNYLFLPGISGNNASSPDSAVLDITGDLDILLRVKPSSWRLAIAKVFLTKYDPATNNRSYRFSMLTTGIVRLTLSQAGTAAVDADSSIAIPVTNAPRWIRATWRQSDGRVQFFYTSDSVAVPTSWTQLGTDKTTSITSIFNSNQPIRVGASTTASETFDGSVYRAIVKNGIDGTTVFDADFSKQTPGVTSFTEAGNGATVTINKLGSNLGRIVGRSNLV